MSKFPWLIQLYFWENYRELIQRCWLNGTPGFIIILPDLKRGRIETTSQSKDLVQVPAEWNKDSRVPAERKEESGVPVERNEEGRVPAESKGESQVEERRQNTR